MRRDLVALVLLILVLAPFPVRPSFAVQGPPLSLSLSVVPPTLPADGSEYRAVYVSFLDTSKSPTAALFNTTVLLTVSNANVGLLVNSSVTIPAGQNFVIARFKTTSTPGKTLVTASATGYDSVSAQVTTAIATGYPTSISVSAAPSSVIAQQVYVGTLTVELQDQVGLPARAIADTEVQLLSSNTNVLNLTSATVTINAGQISASIPYVTGFVPGSAFVTSTSEGLPSSSTAVTVLGQVPLALRLFAQPDKMVTCVAPASSPCTGRLVVALTDLAGNPTRAPRDVVVQVRASNLSVVVPVAQSVTIPLGSISALTSYQTTPLVGNAEVTISSPGLRSDHSTIATSAPVGKPSLLGLFVGPAPVLADHRSYSSVVVSLLNGAGSPTVNSTGPTTVTITSSAASVGNFSSITIQVPQGRNSASVTFTSTFQVGTTSLTVSANNLVHAEASLSTYGAVPSKVAVQPIFPTVPADGAQHQTLQVTLEDSLGNPAIASVAVPVHLSSSQTEVANVDPLLLIPAGQFSSLVNVTTSAAAGKANITAYANFNTYLSSTTTGYSFSSALLSTIIPSPSAIAAYVAPSSYMATRPQSKANLIVQLQDAKGNPARARADTSVTITSSNVTVQNATLLTTIKQGADFAVVPFVPIGPGTTKFTVLSAGFAPGTAQLQAFGPSFQAQLGASPLIILTNETATFTLTITLDGQGLGGAAVQWTAKNGNVSPAKSTTNSAGQATAAFTPSSSGLSEVVAVFVSPAVGVGNLTSTFIVTPAPQSGNLGLLGMLTSFPYVLVLPAAVAGALLGLVFLRRRRGKVHEITDEGYESFSG